MIIPYENRVLLFAVNRTYDTAMNIIKEYQNELKSGFSPDKYWTFLRKMIPPYNTGSIVQQFCMIDKESLTAEEDRLKANKIAGGCNKLTESTKLDVEIWNPNSELYSLYESYNTIMMTMDGTILYDTVEKFGNYTEQKIWIKSNKKEFTEFIVNCIKSSSVPEVVLSDDDDFVV